ncbi:hypothetical protein AB3S75_017507 [Citrus x aurantiifolia]
MSAQVLATVSSSTKKTVRPIAGFHPNLWGDYFLTLASDCKTNDTTHQEEHEALKQEVRSMITATADTPARSCNWLMQSNDWVWPITSNRR